MGLQDVKSDIIQEAESKAEKIEEEAEQQKEEILEEAEQEAEEIRQEHSRNLEQEKQSFEQKKLANARMKARQKKLEAKQEYIRKAFQQFREELDDLDEEEKQEYFENCLEETSFDVGKVIGASEYSEFTDLEFEEKDVDGFILVSEDGERRRDYTFDRVVEHFREKYRKQVADTLFGE